MTDELSKGFTGIEINGVRFSNISEMLQYMDKQRTRIVELEQEVELWKKASENNSYKAFQLQEENKTISGKLTKAKEIIKTFLGFAEAFGYSPSMDAFITEVEQFLK